MYYPLNGLYPFVCPGSSGESKLIFIFPLNGYKKENTTTITIYHINKLVLICSIRYFI